MSIKLVSVILGLILLLVMIPNVASQEYNHNELETLRLYFYRETTLEGQPYLNFGYDHGQDTIVEITIDPDEPLILSIEGVKDRIYNPDIDIKISLETGYHEVEMKLDFQLRCDGDGDGNYDYYVDFPIVRTTYTSPKIVTPSVTNGELKDMSNGTMELEITRRDDSELATPIECSYYTYIQVPFDFDTDGDGVGDYSDLDDDNDGHPDSEDTFPKDRNEWRDSDGDGIGDNEDPDDNENGIPDDFELPLAFGVILIPIVIIWTLINRAKKRSGKNKGGKPKFKPITSSKSGPKNW